MQTILPVKRGADIVLEMQRVDDAGDPVDLTGTGITSKVRAAGFQDSWTAEVTNTATGTFELRVTGAESALWPLMLLESDVRYSDGGAVTFSETFYLKVKEPATR